jgi:hypothetical protein
LSGLFVRDRLAPLDGAVISARIATIAVAEAAPAPASASLSVGSTITRASHRPAHRRGMEAVVHQALGHVLGLDAGGSLQRPQVEDALVRHAAVARRV